MLLQDTATLTNAWRSVTAETQWEFVTSCVHSTAELINTMTRQARSSSYRTMLSYIGQPFIEVQRELGYATGHERGARMRKDWAVSYYRSVYDGRPCLYFVWSHIEHIFCPRRTA